MRSPGMARKMGKAQRQQGKARKKVEEVAKWNPGHQGKGARRNQVACRLLVTYCPERLCLTPSLKIETDRT